jgi:hypothetical protein
MIINRMISFNIMKKLVNIIFLYDFTIYKLIIKEYYNLNYKIFLLMRNTK